WMGVGRPRDLPEFRKRGRYLQLVAGEGGTDQIDGDRGAALPDSAVEMLEDDGVLTLPPASAGPPVPDAMTDRRLDLQSDVLDDVRGVSPPPKTLYETSRRADAAAMVAQPRQRI